MNADTHAPRLVLIASLTAHPDQCVYDGTLHEADEYAQRENLRANGQRDPIKIFADGVIHDGHQRVRLLEELGQIEVIAVVVELSGDEFEQRPFHRSATIAGGR